MRCCQDQASTESVIAAPICRWPASLFAYRHTQSRDRIPRSWRPVVLVLACPASSDCQGRCKTRPQGRSKSRPEERVGDRGLSGRRASGAEAWGARQGGGFGRGGRRTPPPRGVGAGGGGGG